MMSNRLRIHWLRVVSAICALLVAVALGASNAAADENNSDTTAATEAVRAEGLESLRSLLEETNTRAALVMHRGRIVAEWYWHGADQDTGFEVWSVTKSYASTCIGLLIDEGKIESIDDKVHLYVPSWRTGKKAEVTIAHLLEQTSGLEETTGFVLGRDQLQSALNARIISTPGTMARYNNAACNVLSAVISAAAGQDAASYMGEKIWEPLGMKDTSWRSDSAGNVITYAGIRSTARDLARFGSLVHDKGTYEGRRLISEEWIRATTTPRLRLSILGAENTLYGLLWWLNFGEGRLPCNYSALGLFGNNLTIIPELGLVGVRLVGTQPDGAALMPRTTEWVERLAGVVDVAGVE